MDILWLGESNCDVQSLVGGKVANLSRLAPLCHIPPGFCLTTAARDRAKSGVGEAGGSAAGGQLPVGFGAQLAAAYQILGERCGHIEPAVAVRSSAVDEDSAAASFAGQHETYLNVVGVPAIIEAVLRCWASAQSNRAVEYRRQRGLSLETVQMAVLVQQLIVADVSAVVFSANPITGNREEILVNASWGLGESVVGGTVTPDTYVLRKADLSLTSLQNADKLRMTVVVPEGTQEVEVPRSFRHKPAIDENQAVALARMAMDLEGAMGWPVDLECCYRGALLYLLQCRPIASLR